MKGWMDESSGSGGSRVFDLKKFANHELAVEAALNPRAAPAQPKTEHFLLCGHK